MLIFLKSQTKISPAKISRVSSPRSPPNWFLSKATTLYGPQERAARNEPSRRRVKQHYYVILRADINLLKAKDSRRASRSSEFVRVWLPGPIPFVAFFGAPVRMRALCLNLGGELVKWTSRTDPLNFCNLYERSFSHYEVWRSFSFVRRQFWWNFCHFDKCTDFRWLWLVSRRFGYWRFP